MSGSRLLLTAYRALKGKPTLRKLRGGNLSRKVHLNLVRGTRAAMAAASASEAGDLSKLSDSDLVHHMQTCTSSAHVVSALQCLLRRSSSGEWGASTAVVDEMLNIAQRWTGSSAPLLALKVLTNISSSNSYSILSSPDHSSSLLTILQNGDMMRTEDSSSSV